MPAFIPLDLRLDRGLARDASGCLVWQGARNDAGYGVLSSKGRVIRVHRLMWERAHGPIAEGMVVDHLCHNPACSEVAHLRLATVSQNGQNRRGAEKRSLTGVRGVAVSRSGARFYAFVNHGGRKHHLGAFDTPEEAARVSQRERDRLFGAVPTINSDQKE